MEKQKVRTRIEEIGIIPALRLFSGDDARFAADAVTEGGITRPRAVARSSGRIVIHRPSRADGHRKRPFSKRFEQTHSPLPSHTKAFRRLLPRFVRRQGPPVGRHVDRS